jgi:hypothetical protein
VDTDCTYKSDVSHVKIDHNFLKRMCSNTQTSFIGVGEGHFISILKYQDAKIPDSVEV